MERIQAIIEEKYYWHAEYRTALQWAELALNNGVNPLDVMAFIARRLFQKAA